MNDTDETEEEFDETEQTVECPFCGAAYGCEHELLVVDATFRTAERGVLMDAFNDRWSALCETGGDDFDEREPFENLLEEVDALADESTEVDQQGGPGQSSEIVVYWAKNAKDQLARFNSNGLMDKAPILGDSIMMPENTPTIRDTSSPVSSPSTENDSVFTGSPETIARIMEAVRKKYAPAGTSSKPAKK